MSIIDGMGALVKRNKSGALFGGLAGIISFYIVRQNIAQTAITLQFHSILGISISPAAIVAPSWLTLLGFFIMGASIGVVADEIFPQSRRAF